MRFFFRPVSATKRKATSANRESPAQKTGDGQDAFGAKAVGEEPGGEDAEDTSHGAETPDRANLHDAKVKVGGNFAEKHRHAGRRHGEDEEFNDGTEGDYIPALCGHAVIHPLLYQPPPG